MLGVKEKKNNEINKQHEREKKRMRKLTRKDPGPHIYTASLYVTLRWICTRKKKRGGVLQ
jgi:hypothetical protein